GFGIGLVFAYVLLGAVIVGVVRWLVRRPGWPPRRLILADGLGGVVFAGGGVGLALPCLQGLPVVPPGPRPAGGGGLLLAAAARVLHVTARIGAVGQGARDVAERTAVSGRDGPSARLRPVRARHRGGLLLDLVAGDPVATRGGRAGQRVPGHGHAGA